MCTVHVCAYSGSQILLQRLKEAEQFKQWESQEDLVLCIILVTVVLYLREYCLSLCISFISSRLSYGLRYGLSQAEVYYVCEHVPQSTAKLPPPGYMLHSNSVSERYTYMYSVHTA